MNLLPGFAVLFLALALVPPPNPDIADCANAADRYNAAAGRVVLALHDYEACIAVSNGRDNCAAEMQALDDAHDRFAQAVADSKGCQ